MLSFKNLLLELPTETMRLGRHTRGYLQLNKLNVN